MLCVEGFRFGSRTRLAFDQSISSALSCASQNLRSCASDLNFGTLVFVVIELSFLAMHVARRDHPDARSVASQRERYMEATPVERRAESVIARFVRRVPHVRYREHPYIEEYLLGLALGDAVLLVLA